MALFRDFSDPIVFNRREISKKEGKTMGDFGFWPLVHLALVIIGPGTPKK